MCPHCDEVIPEEVISSSISEKSAKMLNDKRRAQQVMNNPLQKWCPNPDCNTIIELQHTTQKEAQCTKCTTKICGLCGQKEHTGNCENSVLISLIMYLLN
jgi:hypothetical protein